MTVKWVVYSNSLRSSSVKGSFAERIQNLEKRNSSSGCMLFTHTMNRRSNFLPSRRSGLSMYFCAIRWVASLSFWIRSRLFVTVMSSDRAKFGCFIIQKLSMINNGRRPFRPFFFNFRCFSFIFGMHFPLILGYFRCEYSLCVCQYV